MLLSRKNLSQSNPLQSDDNNQGSANYYVTLIAGCIGVLLWLGAGNGLAVTTNNSSNNTTTNNATTNGTAPTPLKPLAPLIKAKSSSYTITAGKNISIGISAIDTNNDNVYLITSDLPEGANIIVASSVPGHINASLEWTPTAQQIGIHKITITASDQKLTSSKTITVLVRRGIEKNAAGFSPASASFNPYEDLRYFYQLNTNLNDSSGNDQTANDCSSMNYDMSNGNSYGEFAGESCFYLSSQLTLNRSQHTVSLWFSLGSLSDEEMGLVSLYNDGAFVSVNEGTIYYTFQPGYSYPNEILAIADISDYGWHHLVLSWDGSNTLTYLDGQLAASAPQTFMRHRDGPGEFIVGRTLFPYVYPAGQNSNSFLGNIDNVMLYDRALNLQEVSDLYEYQNDVFLAPELTGSSDAINRVNLAWTDHTSNEEGFKIYRGTSPSNMPLIGTVGPNVTTYANTTGLTANIWYYYRVEAFNIARNEHIYSPRILVKTKANTTPITTPGTFAARVVSSSSIELEWGDASNNEDGFILERGLTSNGPWTLVRDLPARRTTGSFFSGFIVYDSLLNANTRYYYRVRAYNLAGQSANAAVNALTLFTGESAPANLYTEPVSSSQINLQWDDPSASESGFKVQRSTNGTTWTVIATLAANVTMYNATGLTEGTTYYFRVYSYFASGSNAFSRSTQDSTYLAKATALTATPVSFDQINLSWTDNSAKEEGYNIYASSDGEDWVWVDTLIGANIRTYSSVGLTQNSLYYYYVEAYNDTLFLFSLPSNAASAQTPDYNLPAPSGLTATVPSYDQINLTWIDNSSTEDGFEIEQSLDGSTWNRIDEVDSDIETYSVTLLEPHTTYYFRIKAYHSDPFTESLSNVISKQTPYAVLPPSGLTATAISYQQINLAWTDNADNEEGFNILLSEDGIAWSIIDTVEPNIRNYSALELEIDTLYYFRVEAFDDDTNSVSESNTVSRRTPVFNMPAPNGLAASAPSYSQINLAWVDNSNVEDGFRIEISPDGTDWQHVDVVDPNIRNYSVLDLEPDTLYYFRVIAFHFDPAVQSISNVVSRQTPPFNMAAPSHLATSGITADQIDITWRDNSDNEDEFIIQVSTDGVDWITDGNVFADETTYSAIFLEPNTLYYFRIQAYNFEYDETVNSNSISARTLP